MAEDGTDRRVAVAGVLAVVVVVVLVTGVTGLTLSITGRAVLLAALVAGLVVAAAGYRTVPTLGVLAIGLGLLTGVYVPSMWGFSLPVAVGVALVLMSGTVAFVYGVQEGRIYLSRGTVRNVVLALAVVGVLFVGVDLTVGGVEYEVDVYDVAVVQSNERVATVGTATARSTSPLREPVSFPDLRACLYTGDGTSELGYVYRGDSGFFPQSVPGSGNLTADIRVLFTKAQVQGPSDQFPVERAQTCPQNRTDRGIVVVVNP